MDRYTAMKFEMDILKDFQFIPTIEKNKIIENLKKELSKIDKDDFMENYDVENSLLEKLTMLMINYDGEEKINEN